MEGLRALAAVTVIIGHVKGHLAGDVDWGAFTWPWYIASNGLTLFFALSGFLLFRPFASALLTGERFPRLGRYAANRALRIYPMYIVIMLLISLVLGLAYAEPQGATQADSSETVGYLTDPGLLAINATMLQTLFPFSLKTGIGVAWSLTVELIFSVVMPLLALLALAVRRRIGGRHALLLAFAPAAAVLMVGLVGKLVKRELFADVSQAESFVNNWGDTWLAVFSRSFLAHADLFAFGMVAAVLVAAFETKKIGERLASTFRLFAAVIAVGAAASSIIIPNFVDDTTFAVACGALIFFVAMPDRQASPGLLARGLDLAPIRYIGLVSYSAYLWHVPVIWLVDRLGWAAPPTLLGFVVNILLVLAITLAFSTVTYFGVEKPALSLKRRTDQTRRATSSTERTLVP